MVQRFVSPTNWWASCFCLQPSFSLSVATAHILSPIELKICKHIRAAPFVKIFGWSQGFVNFCHFSSDWAKILHTHRTHTCWNLSPKWIGTDTGGPFKCFQNFSTFSTQSSWKFVHTTHSCVPLENCLGWRQWGTLSSVGNIGHFRNFSSDLA